MKKFIKRSLKILGISAATVAGLVICFALLIQIGFFRNWMKSIFVSSLSGNLGGTLAINDIGGNFLTGFTIDSAVISDERGPVITVQHVTCSYDLLTLYRKKLTIRSLVLERPEIHVYCDPGGTWNYSRLFRSKPDTMGGAATWTISFDNIEIRNGRITLLDSAALRQSDHWDMPDEYFEYHRFTIDSLNLHLSAQLTPDEYSARIFSLACTSPESGFRLRQLQGIFTATKSGAAATGLVIRTDRSDLQIDASMRNIDLFSGISLEGMRHDSTTVRLNTTRFDLDELKHFLPQVDFLEGLIGLNVSIGGEFGDLSIRQCDLNFRNTGVSLTGTVRHLDIPPDLTLNVTVGDSRIDPSDVNDLLAGLSIPRFDSLGVLSVNCEFRGKPVNFNTHADVKGRMGHIIIDGGLNLVHRPPSYNFSFTTAGLNLADVYPAGKVRSSINARGTITGQGFSITDLASTLRTQIDSSRINQIQLGNTSVTVTGTSHRIEGNVLLAADNMNASVDGYADYTDPKRTRVGGIVNLTSFNPARFILDTLYDSDLTLHAVVDAAGNDIDDFSGNCDLTLFPSTYRGKALPPGDLHFSVDQHNPDSKLLILQSPFADLSVSGKFDLDLTAAMLAHQANVLFNAIIDHTSPDSLRAPLLPDKLALKQHSRKQGLMDFRYNLDIKSLESISDLISRIPFNAQSTLSGTVHGSTDNMSITLKGPVQECYIGTVRGGILINHGQVSFSADSLSDRNTLSKLRAGLDMTVDVGNINTTPLNSAEFHCRIDSSKASFTLAGRIDSINSLRSIGAISVQPATYVIDCDSLVVSSGAYTWQNRQDIQMRINAQGFRFMHAVMTRNNEELSLAGGFDPNGEVDITVNMNQFDLGGIGQLFRKRELMLPGQGFQGYCDASLHMTGSALNPELHFSATSNEVQYQQTPLGYATVRLDYRDQLATVRMTVKAQPSDTIPSLNIDGSVPINLSLGGSEERFPDREQKIEIISHGFQIGTLGPFLPDFENLSGIISCNVICTGTPRSPVFRGTVDLNDIRFLFGANFIDYGISGTLEPSGDSVIVRKITVRNTKDRNHSGEVTVTGSLRFSDFQVSSFDLLAHGTMLLMTDATRKTIPDMYGTLFAETGSEGLRINGTLDRPYLSGTMYVLDANLVFPPVRLTEAPLTAQTLTYFFIEDTVRRAKPDPALSRFYASGENHSDSPGSPGYRRQTPLVNRVRYNLNVETRGTTAIRMIFTPATSEELYAELEGNVKAINEQGQALIYGEISVTPRSYYYFFKKFDATGNLKFVGPWDNPELDIRATYTGYRQVSSSQLAELKTTEQQSSSAQSSNERKVVVELTITGPRYEPKLVMTMKVQLESGRDLVDWSTRARGGDVQSDIISFILTGKFRDELTSQERDAIQASTSQTVVSGFTSSLLSGILTDFVKQEFPFIRSAEFNYTGGTIQQGADVRLTGEVFNGYWRFGGRIFNDIGNANVTYQLNLGTVLNSTAIRNLFLELERRVEGSDVINEDRTNNATNSARLYYRFSF